ncbi:hypothetical protein Taro_033056, partial [Colocasia esculenta]|nr:hypothetical protein [Colocasia esculenta]
MRFPALSTTNASSEKAGDVRRGGGVGSRFPPSFSSYIRPGGRLGCSSWPLLLLVCFPALARDCSPSLSLSVAYMRLHKTFNWESHKHDWWRNLEMKVPDMANSGFTSVWLPPATHSFAPEGYLPQDLYSLDSAYGSLHLLKALLQKMQQHNIRPMADIVINHRVGTTRGKGGSYNRYDGIKLPWDERAVTSCTGGLETKPIFSVGEYWDSCNYSSGRLDYNQDSHRQRTINWLDSTGGLCSAFDFTTKGILQALLLTPPLPSPPLLQNSCPAPREAVKGELWRLRDAQGKPPGVMGWWPSRSVTFIENHDTGSTQVASAFLPFRTPSGGYTLSETNGETIHFFQGHWPFPSAHVMEGYAYILTHPGTPTVFYDHFYDWGSSLHDQIVKL